MKRIFALFTVFALVFALWGCADGETPAPTEPSTEAVPPLETTGGVPPISHPNMHIPNLMMLCGNDTFQVQTHSVSWYEKEYGDKMTGINIDSVHPKDQIPHLPRFVLPSFKGKTAALSFSLKPSEVHIACYPIGRNDKVSDKAKPTLYTLVDDLTFPLADNSLFIIDGTWNDPDRNGSVHYAFVTGSSFAALDYSSKELYEKYPALKSLDPSALSVHQSHKEEVGEYSFIYSVCFGDVKTMEQYTITLEKALIGYRLKDHSHLAMGEYSAFYPSFTLEKLENAKKDILSQMGDPEPRPHYALSVHGDELILQTERIVDIVTAESLLGMRGCNIDHKHEFFAASVCKK